MASSGARLLTMMLGTVALWALLVLVATWFGLAGRYSLHPEDASQVQAVPEVQLAVSGSRLPDSDHYAAIEQRPLFSADRLPFAGESTAEGDAEPVEEVLMPLNATLTGVIKIGEDASIALVRGDKSGETQSVKVGNNLEGDLSIYKLVQLDARMAVFDGPRGRSELVLETFDGKGGKPPTEIAKQADDQAGAEADADGREEQSDVATGDAETPEARAENIRRRIEERRRQMREEAERARSEQEG